MAFSLNRAQLIGNLGADPDYKTLPSGTPVCKLSIATTDRFKNNEGEWQERTEWHKVTLWRSLADVANQYLKKGAKVFVEGRISTSSYEKDGITRYFTEISAQSLIMLDSKGSGGSYESGGGSSYNSSSNTQSAEPEEKSWEKDLPKDDENDDDIPF
jgi:single-strand DNA-binding protein